MKRLLLTCFGLGWLPVAPGTWGSLPPAIIFGLLCQLHISGILIFMLMAGLVLAASIICVRFVPYIIAATDRTDPSEVVCDEVAGQSVTFLAIPFLGPETFSTLQIWAITTGGFALFRFFDILKPCPIRRLEKLPKGWGVLADDLMAGAYAGVILQILIILWVTG